MKTFIAICSEWLRPWKLSTLAIGLAVLVAGSSYEQLGDWDIGISLIMGILTYLTAPFACRTILRLNWSAMPLAALLAWLSVDGAYWLYNAALGHIYLRDANALASTPLYFMMGCIWMWNGSLMELISLLVSSLAKRP